MTTIYIDSSGSDTTGDGSIGNPYATITKGIDMASNTYVLYITGSLSVSTTINVTKEITLTGTLATTVTKTTSGNLFLIQANNVTISNLTLRTTSTNYVDYVINIDRGSVGTTLPTAYSNVIINGNAIQYWKYGICLNGSDNQIINNTFTRYGASTEKATAIIGYYIRGTTIISSNTLTDSLRVEKFLYLTEAGTGGSDYIDRVNSKGGTITIQNTIINNSSVAQSLIFCLHDYFNGYSYGPIGSDSDYNSNTKLSITAFNNNVTVGIAGKFMVPYLTNNSSLNSYGIINVHDNVLSNSTRGIVHLDKINPSGSLNIITVNDTVHVFTIYSNTITTWSLSSSAIGDSHFTQFKNTAVDELNPQNLYLNTTFITGNKLDQTITFASLDEFILTPTEYTLELVGSASSTLPVSFTSSNLLVATVSDTTLTILTPGIIDITCYQSGNSEYNYAEQIRSFTIVRNVHKTGTTTYLDVPIQTDFKSSEPLLNVLTSTIVDTHYTQRTGISYCTGTGYHGAVLLGSINAFDVDNNPLTVFDVNLITVTFSIPNANILNTLKIYKRNGNVLADPQPTGYPVILSYISGNNWTGTMTRLSDIIVLDENAPGGGAGGDPHVVDIKGNKILLPNDWTNFILYKSGDITVTATCEFIVGTLFFIDKYGNETEIDRRYHKWVDKYTYINTVTFETYGKKLIIDTIDGIIVSDNSPFIYEIVNSKGLYSFTHNRYYPAKKLLCYVVYLDDNYMTITIDNHWDDINDIRLYMNTDVDGCSGELIVHSEENIITIRELQEDPIMY